MKYLEISIKFLIKNWILAIPLFVLVALAALLGGTSSVIARSADLWQAYASLEKLTDPGSMLSSLPAVLPSVAAGNGIWALLFNFAAIPATYGLVNKSLDTGIANINDIGAAVSQNFVKYVIYFVGVLVLSIALGLGTLIILLVFILLAALIKPLIILTVIVAIALAVAILILMVLLSMWLSAMVVDGLDLLAAAKKSVEIVRSRFWTVLGITLLIAVACGIAGWILGLLTVIPLLGPIIASIVPALQTFIMIVFLLILYRDSTGRMNTL
jgi:hypothetical protein